MSYADYAIGSTEDTGIVFAAGKVAAYGRCRRPLRAAVSLTRSVTLVERGALTGEYVGRHRTERQSASRFGSRLFSRSRFRRAKALDALAVALLLAVVAALGCAVVMLSTGTAKADNSDALAFAAEFGPGVCLTLDEFPTFGGVIGVSTAIVNRGQLSYRDAGAAIYSSVSEICPRHMGLIMRFAGANTHKTPIAGVA